jgi:hypothetical protein
MLGCFGLAVLLAACSDAVTVPDGMDPSISSAGGVAITPTSASLSVGESVQLEVDGGAPNNWSSSDDGIATVSSGGIVTAVSEGTATITARVRNRSGTAIITVEASETPPGSPPAPPPPSSPVGAGIWISKAELDLLPMSGAAWSGSGELKATADATWTVQRIEQQSGQVFNVQAMAGALVFARLHPDPSAEQYRTKVVRAIRDVMAQPDDLSSSATAPNRNLGAWAISADLIDLPVHDPALDAEFRAWLRHKLDLRYQSSPATIREQIARPNNQGSYASFSLAATSAYLGDRATLDLLAIRMRRYLGDTSAPYQFHGVRGGWGAGSNNHQHTWQEDPNDPGTWRGIVRRGVVRDGNNFDGIQPEDHARNEPGTYDRSAFPNTYTTRYNEVSMEALLGAVLILYRAGYADLPGLEDEALLRAARWIKYAADTHPEKGYRYFTDALEASRPLINYFYGARLPEDRTRNQLQGRAFGYGWTYWTHAGRQLPR